MKPKKLTRLAAMLALGWAVAFIAKLFITAIMTSVIIGIVYLVGTILQVRLPYKTITVLVLAALTVLTALVVLAALPVKA
jgi:hypothetical protein